MNRVVYEFELKKMVDVQIDQLTTGMDAPACLVTIMR